MKPFLSSLLSRLLVDRKNGHRRAVLAAFAEKQRVASLSEDEQEQYRNDKLAKLLNHAREHVPFWKDKIPDEVNPQNARHVLKTLPMMERTMIQEDRGRFVAEGGRNAGNDGPCTIDDGQKNNDDGRGTIGNKQRVENEAQRTISPIAYCPLSIALDATGGSSGTPMRFLVDRATQIARESSLYWSDSLAGWRYGDRIAMLWGSDKDIRSAARDAKLALRWWIDNRRWYNAFNMGEERMAEFHESMTRFRPHILVAYAGSLDIYARFLGERDETRDVRPETLGKRHDLHHGKVRCKTKTTSLDHSSSLKSQVSRLKSHVSSLKSHVSGLRSLSYPLTALISSAEVLTPEARHTIETVFGVRVFNRYGNREFGAIAAEDGRGGMAVNPTDVVLETGEDGELLVTYLNNLAMPFIRYRTGDLVAWSKGEEGRRIEKVHGRSGDTIRTRGGALIHGEYFTHLMYGAKGVKEFQFVQETLDHYQLLVVGEEPTPEVVAHWRKEFAEVLGPEANVKIMRVEAIPVLPSGKRKFTVSTVYGL